MTLTKNTSTLFFNMYSTFLSLYSYINKASILNLRFILLQKTYMVNLYSLPFGIYFIY